MFDFAAGSVNAVFPDTILDFLQVSGTCSSKNCRTKLLSMLLLSAKNLFGLLSMSLGLSLLVLDLGFLSSFSIHSDYSQLIVTCIGDDKLLTSLSFLCPTFFMHSSFCSASSFCSYLLFPRTFEAGLEFLRRLFPVPWVAGARLDFLVWE